MYVRLAFAVAAYLDTEILLVDEVLAVGDYEFQKKCLGTMGQVSREGRTIIFVSHNMLAIRSLCNRGIFLRHGQKAFDGEITAAIEAYIQKHASATTEWQRPADRPISPIGYKSISVSLLGKQPAMKLKFSASLHCSVETAPTFIAVDVKDRLLAPVMQALPSATPFVPGKPGPIHLSFEIDLPPLVPGIYYLDLWIGHHYSKTCDYVENALGFEVADSPTPGRGYPHTLDHGSIVPNSRVLA
jgi:lipopolysaccharide transport system ATP-binding protein